MSERMVYVHINLSGENHLVGRLWEHSKNGRYSGTFQYDTSWLDYDEKFALEPLLQLTTGSFHTSPNKSIFGSIGDSAPDTWGRVLMRRSLKRSAVSQGSSPRSFSELNYLLAVSDEARQGALRFSHELEGEFLSPPNLNPIPPLLDLSKLLSATESILNDQETEEELKLLLVPGSSLGGARPKASIRDKDGHLTIAKFSSVHDEFSTILWEGVALKLASLAEIETPQWHIEDIHGKKVILIRRFDREGDWRIPFISAMSMLNAKDNEHHSYLELADAIRQYGATPKHDLKELWKRIVFNILISNTDDHLRNHAFLYRSPKGWSLSPVYDINPTPIEIKPRILTTAIDFDDGTADLNLALSVYDYFDLSKAEAHNIIYDVGTAVSAWRDVAKTIGISNAEINRMSSAFDHKDLECALHIKRI